MVQAPANAITFYKNTIERILDARVVRDIAVRKWWLLVYLTLAIHFL